MFNPDHCADTTRRDLALVLRIPPHSSALVFNDLPIAIASPVLFPVVHLDTFESIGRSASICELGEVSLAGVTTSGDRRPERAS